MNFGLYQHEDTSRMQHLTIKYCELCCNSFVTGAAEVMEPGKFIEEQRSAHHRAPVICARCITNPPADFGVGVTQKEVSTLRQHYQESRKRARKNWASWRIPLMQALQEQKEMTSVMIAKFMGVGRGTNAVACARSAGIPLVVVRKENYFHGGLQQNRRRNWYGLSVESMENLPPLTTPQDSVTHKFMREASA